MDAAALVPAAAVVVLVGAAPANLALAVHDGALALR